MAEATKAKKKKGRAPVPKVKGQTLRKFRNALPTFRRYEYWTDGFFSTWDVVKGQWLALAMEPVTLDLEAVNLWARVTRLAYPADADPQGQDLVNSPVDEMALKEHWDALDLGRPLLFGAKDEKVPAGGLTLQQFLLDGHHRLRKAFLEQKPLTALFLTKEQTLAIKE